MKRAEAKQQEETTTLDRLADLQASARPLRLVLLGEFSAGKSSLVNLLIGNDLLPTGVLATTRRLTELRYAEQIEVAAVDRDGRRRAIDPALSAQSNVAHGYFDIGLPCERLKNLVLIDTSGFADPNRDASDTLEAAEQCDVAIWCTRAHQAWRHSERMVWSSLPAHLRETGLLVVTRGDKLAKASDRRSLMARLRQDAGAMFQGIVLLSIPDAVFAQGKQPEELDVALWKRSGGEALATELLQSLSRAGKRALPSGEAGAERRMADPITVAPPAEPERPAAPATATPLEDPAATAPLEDPVAEKDPGGIEHLLRELLSTIDGCQLAACIDLDQKRTVALESSAAAGAAAIDADLAALAASLFTGPISQPMRDVSATFRSNRIEADGAIEAVTIERRRIGYIFWRRPDSPNQIIVLAATGQASIVGRLGILQIKARQLGSAETAV